MIDTVLFDLDGTLSDSAPGILGSLQLAFAELGIDWPPAEVARTLVGPPLYDMLPPFVGADRVDEAITRYRKHYVGGGAMLETECFDGAEAVLAELAERGIRLAVATSKPEPYAVQIVAHLGLDRYFQTVCGDTVDGARNSKQLVIGEALTRLGEPAAGSVLMVGDRSHDVLGASAHGLACVGALWGYGTAAELADAGAGWLCAAPGELVDVLDGRPARPGA